MKFILAEKIEMSQIFDKNGNVVPVTIVRAAPNVVLQVKVKDKDGYEALQVGFGARKQRNIKKPQRGHFKDLGSFRHVREYRLLKILPESVQNPAQDKADHTLRVRGEKIDVSVFQEGDVVRVSGVSKAKGFQGVVKRHGFHGAPKTHGTKHAHRQPGSIGATWPQRVIKGRRMAGRMGGERITVKNLKVVKIDQENNMLAIDGSVPGRRGTLLEIRG